MVDITITVPDPDGDPVTITVTGISDDEGSDPDDVVTGTSPQVRAQRDGKGDGRAYTISFEVSDGTDTVSGTVTVTVPHDQGKRKAGKVVGLPTDMLLNVAAFEAMFGGRSEIISSTPSFHLAQNTPNPFNPATSIQYMLTEASNVRLLIYNILGQQVRVLVNGAQLAGTHSVVWDGRDAFGRDVSSGLYLYRLEAGDYTAMRKMMFAK